jgi:hypothetical protein
MKRDMNLIRKIMLEVEEGTPSTYYPNESALESLYPSDLIVHNALLILDAGWAIGTADEANGLTRSVCIERLTFAGHEFLALIKPDRGWSAIQRQRDLELPVSAIVEILKTIPSY